jgi:hypothetical protein
VSRPRDGAGGGEKGKAGEANESSLDGTHVVLPVEEQRVLGGCSHNPVRTGRRSGC